MPIIDSTNAKEHSFPIYGRQFKSYKWYKPILVGVVFMFFYLLFAAILLVGVRLAASYTATPDSLGPLLQSITVSGYDSMDLANGWQSLANLGSIALMIPALWLTSAIVRDRPFSSYSSSRGGWSAKVFWKVFPVAFVCISIPIIVDELFYKHHLGDFQMKFTLASFVVVTLLGPLQCIAEEYVFRGLLMQTLGSWFRLPILAVILQSVVFVLVHPYDMIGKIGILATGMVFALTAWMGRGVEISSAFHICNNMTIFYLQGMNMAEIKTNSNYHDLAVEIITGVVFVLVIFIISKKTDWFSKIKKDDAAAWNARIDEKLARKEAKAAAKAEKNAPIGNHDSGTVEKHLKQ